jgi:hypothetical protein
MRKPAAATARKCVIPRDRRFASKLVICQSNEVGYDRVSEPFFVGQKGPTYAKNKA